MQVAVSRTSSKRGRLDAIIDSGLALLPNPETALWHMLWSMAGHSAQMARILKKENKLYEALLAKELRIVAPHLSARRRIHIAKLVRAMKGLQSEMKSAVLAIVDGEARESGRRSRSNGSHLPVPG
jgi:hypothetical protein